MAEGNSTPEQKGNSGGVTNEYGEIQDLQDASTSAQVTQEIDPDDLPENQGMTPAMNLAKIRQQLLANAKPFTGSIPAPEAKPIQVAPISPVKP